MSAGGLRLAARLARREVSRRPWRTLLVAMLVAGPVAGMTVAVVAIRTSQLTSLEAWRLENGGADAVLGSEDREGAPNTAASVPPGSRLVSYQSDYRLLRTAGGRRVSGEISDLPVTDPLLAGTIGITGRAPALPSEVLLSPGAARKLGVGVGDTLDLDRPIDATVTVVGVGWRGFNDNVLLLLHPDASFPVRPGGDALSRWNHLVDLSDQLTPAQVEAWASESGARTAPGVVPSNEYGRPAEDRSAPVRWSWFAGAVVLTVMGIVISSAFATGARRQLTTLGQLSANGASPATVRRVLMLQGTWTGLAGAVAGLALGAAALAALAPHRDRLLGQRVTSYDVNGLDLVPIVLMGIAASTVAALVPARSASRIPVLAALAGRRPLAAVPRWLTMTGVAVSTGGLALLALATVGSTAANASAGNVWTMTGIAGGIALLLGVCAVAPGYVSVLGPAAARLGGSWRLAARSLARQRSRTGAVVSAVCVSAALAVALSAIFQSVETGAQGSEMARDRVLISTSAQTGSPNPENGAIPEVILTPPPDVVDRLRAVLPGAQTLQQSWVALAEEGDRVAAVADPALLDTYGFGPAVRRALVRAGLVSLSPDGGGPAGSGGGMETAMTVQGRGRQPATVRAPVVVVNDLGSIGHVPPVLITPGRAAELGLTPQPGDVVLRLPRDLTADQRTAVDGVFEEQLDEQPGDIGPSGTPPPFTSINFYRPYGAPDPFVVDAVLGGVALLFALFVVAASLALAAAETRDERDVLTVVGASPRTIRRTSGVKAVVVSAFGTALAVPVGLLPVLVFTSVETANLPFVFPWRVVTLLLLAVPLTAGLATTSASALALRLRPVRTSTMAFE